VPVRAAGALTKTLHMEKIRSPIPIAKCLQFAALLPFIVMVENGKIFAMGGPLQRSDGPGPSFYRVRAGSELLSRQTAVCLVEGHAARASLHIDSPVPDERFALVGCNPEEVIAACGKLRGRRIACCVRANRS
jgi:hypothetical protein